MPIVDASAPPLTRVVVVSASIGAGHDVVARELIRRLAERGVAGTYLDLTDLLPARLGAFVRRSYEAQLTAAPRSYQWLYDAQDRSRLFAWGHRRFAALAIRRLRRALPPDTSVLLATSPDAAQAIGLLRVRGAVSCPTLVVTTDFAAHRSWVARGIDRYAVVHPATGDGMRRRGAQDVVVTGPTVRPWMRSPMSLSARAALRVRVRRELGLPVDSTMALVAGGSWGVGAVEATTAALTASGGVVPVVLCGRNAALRQRLTDAGIVALGWRDDVAELMHASDVLVENAGGQTCQEAFAAGLPVVTVSPLPGHGVDNAEVMRRSGVTTYVEDVRDLSAGVREALALAGRRAQAAGELFSGDAADVVIAMGQPAAVPVHAVRPPRRARAAAVTALAAATSLITIFVGLPAAAAREVGVQDHLRCEQRCVHVVVQLSSRMATQPQLLQQVEALGATVAVPDTAAPLVARLSPRTEVATPVDGAPGLYEVAGAPTRGPGITLFAARHPTVLQLGVALARRDRAWRPALIEHSVTPSSPLPVGGMVLVDLRRVPESKAVHELEMLERQISRERLTVLALPEAASARA